MGTKIKIILKILILMQIACCLYAQPYRSHPDAEVIDVGNTNHQATIEAAKRRGMDGTAVAELLRTRQPVVRTSTDPITGTTKTTTYKLDADGSIASHTVTKSRSHTTFRSPQQLPEGITLDDLLKSPSGSITRTYTDADGRQVTQTYRVNKPRLARPIDDSYSNNRHSIKPLSSSWPDTETSALFGDDNKEIEGDWFMIADDPEPTTKRPKVIIEPIEYTTKKPLLSLDEFLEQQYGRTTTPKTIKTIKLEDLPITDILYNGKPAGKDIIDTLPSYLRPVVTSTENIIKTENIPPMVGGNPAKVDTNITKFSTTHTGSSKPALEDLSPEMQNVLKRAGISTDDLSNIEGDTITKTRKEPDGRVITTRYNVRTLPTTVSTHEFQTTFPKTEFFSSSSTFDTKPFDSSSFDKSAFETFGRPSGFDHSFGGSPSHDFPSKSFYGSTSSFDSTSPFHTSFKTFQSSFNPSPISQFLAKLGLFKSDILAKNGELSKTIVDDDGQILTATFVLSQPLQPAVTKKTEEPKMAKFKPFK